jgi:hypothetical protein
MGQTPRCNPRTMLQLDITIRGRDTRAFNGRSWCVAHRIRPKSRAAVTSCQTSTSAWVAATNTLLHLRDLFMCVGQRQTTQFKSHGRLCHGTCVGQPVAAFRWEDKGLEIRDPPEMRSARAPDINTRAGGPITTDMGWPFGNAGRTYYSAPGERDDRSASICIWGSACR